MDVTTLLNKMMMVEKKKMMMMTAMKIAVFCIRGVNALMLLLSVVKDCCFEF